MPLPLWGTVRLDADERLDKPDALALQNMNMEYVVRAIGAAFGWGGGCTTPPTVTFQTATAPRTLKLGGFQYYVCEPLLPEQPVGVSPFSTIYKGFRGNFLTCDPADSGQITDIPFDAVWAAAQANYASPVESMYPFLYAQPVAVDVDADARIVWDGGLSDGVPTTIKTRTVVRHLFTFSTSAPQDMLGWAPILQITWPDLNPLVGPGQPNVRYIGWKDTQVTQAVTEDTDSLDPVVPPLPDKLTWPTATTTLTDLLMAKQQQDFTDVPNSDISPEASPFADMGLIQIMQILQSKVVRGMDVSRSRAWYQKQAGSNPAVARGTLELFSRPYTALAAYIEYSSGGVVVGGSRGAYGASSASEQSFGTVRVFLDVAISAVNLLYVNAAVADASGIKAVVFVPSSPTITYFDVEIMDAFNVAGPYYYADFFITAMVRGN